MRILVVGLGNIACRHIRNLKALESDITIAVWRQRPDPPEWQPPEGLPVDRWLYKSYEVVAWRADAEIIANPASMHMRTALTLDPAHLFIEKPISDVTGELLDGLVSASQVFKRVLMVGYDLRFYRPLQLVKTAIEEGRIGRLLSIRCEVGQYLPDWRPGRDYRQSVSAQAALGGGVLLELSHEIDYARWLMGEVTAVSAMTGRLSDLEIDVEDTADILLRFESGALGSIHMDMADRATVRKCRIVGTKGSITCDILTGQADLFTYHRDDSPIVQPRFSIVLPDEPVGPRMQWTVLHEGLTVIPDAFLAEMRNFLACCRGAAVPPVSGIEARRVLEICLAAKRGAEERREISL